MSQYGQQTQSNSEKKYVVGSMTTRKEIEQDAKDDVSQFNITFSEVCLEWSKQCFFIGWLYLCLSVRLVMSYIQVFSTL